MASILLVRHGPVAHKAPGLLSFGDFARWIDAYEASGLEPDAAPPAELLRAVAGIDAIFASDAPRVIDTLARLGRDGARLSAQYREAPPLAPRLPLKLPAHGWLVLARLRGEISPALAEARRDLRKRAQDCAGRLAEAAQRSPVALIGHGWFNRSVAADLRTRGWRASGPGFGKPWGFLSLEPCSAPAADAP